jgi:hypothetical protein
MFVCSAVAGVATPPWPNVKPHLTPAAATISRPRPLRPADAGPPSAAGRPRLDLRVGVVGDLLLEELEAELQHRGGILDRHAGPIGQAPPTVTPSFSEARLASAPNAAISTSGTGARCCHRFAAPSRRRLLAEQLHVFAGARYLVDDGDAR